MLSVIPGEGSRRQGACEALGPCPGICVLATLKTRMPPISSPSFGSGNPRKLPSAPQDCVQDTADRRDSRVTCCRPAQVWGRTEGRAGQGCMAPLLLPSRPAPQHRPQRPLFNPYGIFRPLRRGKMDKHRAQQGSSYLSCCSDEGAGARQGTNLLQVI